jgi:segregation and condensation protein B
VTGGLGADPLWREGGDLVGALEALFSAASEVLTLARLRELTGLGEGAIRQGVDALQARCRPPRGVLLLEVGGGWRLAVAPEYAGLVARMAKAPRPPRLTQAQTETLAIIAYRQPITMPEMCEIRGVTSVSNQVRSLLEREMIAPVGRRQVVGRPMMYATSDGFLLRFGLRGLQDLPRLSDFGEGGIEAEAEARLASGIPSRL